MNFSCHDYHVNILFRHKNMQFTYAHLSMVLWNFFSSIFPTSIVQHLPRICGQNEDKIVPSPTNSPAPKDHFKFWANAGRFIEMKMSRTSYWGGPSSSKYS